MAGDFAVPNESAAAGVALHDPRSWQMEDPNLGCNLSLRVMRETNWLVDMSVELGLLVHSRISRSERVFQHIVCHHFKLD